MEMLFGRTKAAAALYAALVLENEFVTTHSFSLHPSTNRESAIYPFGVCTSPSIAATLCLSGSPNNGDKDDDAARQWELFTKHHAKGRWLGTWKSYDYLGDEIDSTTASVVLNASPNREVVQHDHEIFAGSATSDCNTCFDSMDVRTIPIAEYAPGRLGRQRLGSVGMVVGPSLLRSGAMSTELVLSYEASSRVRVVFWHGPCWPDGAEPNIGPPSGLKLYRVMVSREALGRTTAPTPESDPDLFRGVPPFAWHARWAGTSWTYGPENGDRGWSIEEMEEHDAWHGRPTGDNENIWSLRFNRGGVLLQCPRIVYGGEVGLCRLAWMPEPDDPSTNRGSKLFRLEAGVSALNPVEGEDGNEVVTFMPPRLSSLRCDTLVKIAPTEAPSSLERKEDRSRNDDETGTAIDDESKGMQKSKGALSVQLKPENSKDDNDGDLEPVRLKLENLF